MRVVQAAVVVAEARVGVAAALLDSITSEEARGRGFL